VTAETAAVPARANRGARIQAIARGATSETALILGTVTLLGLAIRLYRLDGLPAEMWGDVTTHYQLAQKVMSGHPFFDYEFGGDGPMLSYLVAAVASLGGLSFFTLKLTTVLIGTAVVTASYFMAETLFDNRQVGLITAIVTAVSFWDLTFSRQAKPYILVPLFTCLAVTFAARRMPVPAGIALGLGMYTQAAFWGVPVAFLIMPTALLVGALVAIPVIDSFIRNPSSLVGSSSYIGSKLHTHHTLTQTALSVLANIWKNALSFNVRGDVTFRHNIPLHPHLDVLSGVLFLAGMALILWRIARQHDWKLLWWFLIPFMAAQIPSVLDTTPGNVPNMGRMIGAMPFAYAAIAYAIFRACDAVCRALSSRSAGWLASAGLMSVLLAAIFCINMYNYFVVYPGTLPNGNTPYDLVIARQVDAAGAGATSIVVGCCWGDWGQPEPDAIRDRSNPAIRLVLASDAQTARQDLATQVSGGADVVVYTDPATPASANPVAGSLQDTQSYVLRENGWAVARVFQGRKR
jgi:hypothetical protein